MKSSIVLFSGGLDSTFLAYKLAMEGVKVYPLIAHRLGEFQTYDFNVAMSALKLLDKYTVLVQPFLKFNYDPNPYVAGDRDGNERTRHTLYLSQAVHFASKKNCDYIALGVYEKPGHEVALDCMPTYLNAFRKFIKVSDTPKLKLITLKSFEHKLNVLTYLSQVRLLGEFLGVVRWCYKRKETKMPWGGYGCGSCYSCKLISKEYEKFDQSFRHVNRNII